MDPSRRGTYRPANDGDDREVRIVVDIFNETPPNYNNTAYRSDVARAPATRRPEIDLNNPAKQEEESSTHAPVVNEPVQAPVEDYTGSSWSSHDETEFDLNAAVREAQDRDEAYCQERLENLRKGKAMEDDQDEFRDMSFRSSSPDEDPDYYKLWND